ncbi:hypothetical protein FQR65_LT16445 [Abscondita terminalis]|nr:hypothetical protein FQR65_LT16445 [Abscondita terminalis]
MLEHDQIELRSSAGDIAVETRPLHGPQATTLTLERAAWRTGKLAINGALTAQRPQRGRSEHGCRRTLDIADRSRSPASPAAWTSTPRSQAPPPQPSPTMCLPENRPGNVRCPASTRPSPWAQHHGLYVLGTDIRGSAGSIPSAETRACFPQLDGRATSGAISSYLIHDLDEISKLESGRISLNIEKFDLSELIKETIENLDDKAKSQKIDIVFKQKYQNVTFVKADRKKIQQVLTNLIDNSIKYGKTGGSTDIRIFPLFEQVLVEVTDDGQGGYIENTSHMPEWIPLTCYAAISAGTMSGGWKIVKTMGTKITKVTPLEGVSAETAGAVTLYH